jgi:hypothetical protein
MTGQKRLRRADVSEEPGPNKQNRHRRNAIRIVIAGNCDPGAISAAIQEWLVPLLVNRFITQHCQRVARAPIDGNG